jgi:hypothetical protein
VFQYLTEGRERPMKRWSQMLTVAGLGIAMTLTLATSPALALSLTGNYFTLSATHPDTLGGIDGSTVTGLVSPALVGGLPAYTGALPPASGAITDVGAGNAIQWWTAHGGIVTADKVQADTFTAGVLGGGAFANNFFPTARLQSRRTVPLARCPCSASRSTPDSRR